MIGRLAKKEYLAADFESRPITRPVIMVEPERETPGTKAKVCAKPIARARPGVNSFSSFNFDKCGNLFTKIIIKPTKPIAKPIVVRLEKNGIFSITFESTKPMMPAGIEVIKIFSANL